MLLVACSGPGAMGTIAGNFEFSRWLSLYAVALAFASAVAWIISRRLPFAPPLCVLLAWFHPIYSVSATRGDCGYKLVSASLTNFGGAALFLAFQAAFVFRTLRTPRDVPREGEKPGKPGADEADFV